MKKKIAKLATMGMLTSTILISSFYFVSNAEELTEPTKPTIEGEVTNDKINQYNQEVDNYNQAVDDYNQQVDDYNKQIDNDYEQEKAKVDEQNAAVDAHNQAEDAQAAAIKAENEQIQAQYDTDYAQYQSDLATYESKEQQILNIGYNSVEQYNETMDTYYNDPYNEGLEKNADENAVFDIEESYNIDAATECSTNTYQVEIEHNFKDNDTLIKSYKTNFEIKEDDIITFKPAGTQSKIFSNQYHYGFFTRTDDDHLGGYWHESDSELDELCNYVKQGWDTGDTHTISYKDGQRTSGDTTITMIYNYIWKALKQVKTYTKPEEPKLELKEKYIPQYQEKIADPIKKNYMTHIEYLSKMDSLPEPIPTPSTPEPEKTETPSEPKPEEKSEEPTPAIYVPSTPIVGEESIIEVEQGVIEKPNTQPRMAQTSDTISSTVKLARRLAIIIICIAIIILLIFVDKIDLS